LFSVDEAAVAVGYQPSRVGASPSSSMNVDLLGHLAVNMTLLILRIRRNS